MKKEAGHSCTQMGDPGKTQAEGGHLLIKEKNLRRNQPANTLISHSGLPDSEEIHFYC